MAALVAAAGAAVVAVAAAVARVAAATTVVQFAGMLLPLHIHTFDNVETGVRVGTRNTPGPCDNQVPLGYRPH